MQEHDMPQGDVSVESYDSSLGDIELEMLQSFSQNANNYNHHPSSQAEKQLINQSQEDENIQTPPGFELTQDNSLCKICYRYAINSVLCGNSKCSILLCGNCLKQLRHKKKENKCPFCRSEPFTTVRNPIRSIINKIQVSCKLCKDNYILKQEEKHFKLKCSYFHKTKCHYCQQFLEKDQIVKHTRFNHQDKLDQMIENIYSRPPPVGNPALVLEQRSLYLNHIDKSPQLGTTGKFYCGGRLQPPKCSCCNGYCGPTNGQNCFQCMKLDILRMGLPKGFLVNSEGKICWRQKDSFICGGKDYYTERCTNTNPCHRCQNMTENIERYKDLL